MAKEAVKKVTDPKVTAKRQSMTPEKAKALGLDPSVYGKAGKK